jgi:drug/metabolite transporter (DMT)-like permease
VKALRLLPTRIVMTYAYVNPVIAIVLGWIILDEPITVYTISGTLLVVLGVMGIFREKKRIA